MPGTLFDQLLSNKRANAHLRVYHYAPLGKKIYKTDILSALNSVE